MTLESQVTSLELAQKLKELGVKQESLFSYERFLIEKHNPKVPVIHYHAGYTRRIKQEYVSNLYFVSAFTVAELGEMLPMMYQPIKDESNGKWLYIKVGGTGSEPHKNWADTEADARAKTLIYLLENGLLKA